MDNGGDSLAHLQPFGRALLSIEGMWCPSCAAATAQVLQRLPGVHSAQVSFATSSVLLQWDPQVADLEQARGKIGRLGYRLLPAANTEQTLNRIDQQTTRLSIRLAVAVMFGMWTMLCSLLLYIGGPELARPPTGYWLAVAAGVAAIPVLAFAGSPIFLAGWRTLRTGVPGMDTLVSLGVLAGVGLSLWQLSLGQSQVYFDTAVMLVILLTIGRLIETRTLRHAARAIGALQDMLPESAERLEADGRYRQLPARSIRVGDRVRISAGDRAALDGYVVSGRSELDCAALTGESRPRSVGPGDAVEAGTVNLNQPLDIVVSKAVGQRHIDAIGVSMAEAAGRRGNTQRLADVVARFIVPAALLLAVVTFIVSWLTGVATDDAALRAVAVLIIACPCAVSIAVPIAYVAAASQAADSGILFRDPAAIETLAKVHTMVLDKTGTLTYGRPGVSSVRFHYQHSDISAAPALLALVARAEEGIAHPLAAALRAAAAGSDAESESEKPHTGQDDQSGQSNRSGKNRLNHVDAKDNQAHAERFQRGVRLNDGQLGQILVGSKGFLKEMDVATNIAEKNRNNTVEQEADTEGSQIEVAVAGHWLATITLQDQLREDAATALAQLQHMGIRCFIASGDGRGPVQQVGGQLKLPKGRLYWECSPQTKADLIAQLGSRRVAFAGDGINDGPALAAAEVGIAVADATSTATAAANVVVASGGVTALPIAILHAKRARKVMQQNLFFAVIYNALGLTMAAAGLVSPVVAALAMAASSISVTANASRLALTPVAQSASRFAPRPQAD